MRVRHLLALGVVFGAFGAADLHRAQAQSVKMVRFLLNQENHAIAQAENLITRQDFIIRELNILYTGLSDNLSSRQNHTLISHIVRDRSLAFNLQNSINNISNGLNNLDNRTLNTVQTFDPDGTTPYTNQAFNNDSVIFNIVSRSPYGLTPATLTQ